MPGLKLQARGYYFDGLGKDDLGKVIAPNARESADAFLARLASSGYEPSAYGKASFTSVGQRVRVRAMAKPDGDAAYLTPKTGGFGTWVWVFRRSEQSKRAQEYLTGDWVSPFMEASESNGGAREGRSHVDGYRTFGGYRRRTQRHHHRIGVPGGPRPVHG